MVCPSALAFILNNPVRRALTDRHAVIAESHIDKKSIVLEVGAGNGFFTEVLVHEAKKVYAVELQSGMIRKLRKRIPASADNVEIIEMHIADLELVPGIVDVAFFYYAFHEVDNQEKAAEKTGRAVRKGGWLSLYEPRVEVSAAMMESSVAMFEKTGFVREAGRESFFTRFAGLRKER
ncbi:16S ribosomal RNA methyltransferase KsgA/Dim1 family protein [bacterium BMS3Abin07]|nr:16S ribosomal RNA methyltransferase KsgA/Dim1 family protein [bacterium BMS3Abin07]GBE32777.1 16S ribosomal RNA methyltransferase KsgA/Dim1 family protein [bacterium BMS3Bbin05]HDO21570.1 class I SAM-dependent methyltransferase [Nitrospirota bacterium]HDZ87242.1 class I SAM-dependent methyltransferase [Nitrospirota bacterium]